MDPFFEKLGREILAEWQQQNFSLPAFPGIAQTALEARPPSRYLGIGELIRDFLINDQQPHQTSSGFGQPELIVFEDTRFYIQVLFWLDGTTQIHQHEFSGAFHVLEGSSLHSEFVFENPRPISAPFRLGQLKLSRTEYLETGRTVPIVSGGSCIHSLFHLEMPSLTVVVRTHSDPGTGPQFTYLPPHVAVDPFFTDALTTRRNQLLDVLERVEDRTYADGVREMVGDLDFERGFFVLQNCRDALQRIGEWEDTWAVFAKKHGQLAAPVLPTLDEMAWRDAVVRLRASIEDPAHRFFLALLLNLPDRESILKLVAKRFPGPAKKTILRWAQELSESSDAGTWVVDAQFPEEIELPPEKQLPLYLAALRGFLDGGKTMPAVKGLTREDMKAVKNSLLHSSLRALIQG